VKYVDKTNPIVEKFNRQVSKDQEFRVKTTCDPLTYDWTLPKEYKTLDVVAYVADKHIELEAKNTRWTDKEIAQRSARLAQELDNYYRRGLTDVLRAIIFVINTLTRNNIVWGVGRGSSVSSYVLYVIGVHDVDSYAYQLDIDDFLHD
jgi:DNA polymerase III alpha subunit